MVFGFLGQDWCWYHHITFQSELTLKLYHLLEYILDGILEKQTMLVYVSITGTLFSFKQVSTVILLTNNMLTKHA